MKKLWQWLNKHENEGIAIMIYYIVVVSIVILIDYVFHIF